MTLTRASAAFLSLALCASFCLAQTVLDDADPQITYTGNWQHDASGQEYLSSGTQSWTDDPSASLAFTFDGTGFDLCAGLKSDRGTFDYSIDGAPAGSGTQAGDSMDEQACSNVASVRNLESGSHNVIVTHTGGTYLALDSITTFSDGPVSAFSAPSSSPEMRTRPSTTLSISLDMSSTIGKATISPANRTARKEEEEGSGSKAAVVGGSVAGGVVAALLLGVAFWLFRRRQNADRDSMLYPDKFSPSAEDLDEKTFDWNEKRPLSTAAGPAGGLSRSHGASNLHKRQISKQDSLESFTEAYQPSPLAHPPTVEPYYPAQFTPTHSHRNSLNNAYPSNPINPFVAPLRTKSSYDDRLAAASASLPDFHYESYNTQSAYNTSQPIPRTLQIPKLRVNSEVSVYPATERESERHSVAYSGMDDDPYGGYDDDDRK